MTWQEPLDRARTLVQLDTLAAEPGAVAERLAAEVPADLEARDALIARALSEIDVVAVRAMKLRLEHALAGETSIGAPTRNVFAQTITAYARDLPLLAERARDVAARGRAAAPDHVAGLVVDAARAVLALRDALRAGILELVRTLATAAIPDADRRARDRTLADRDRTRWSAIRRDLEALVADPAALERAPMVARLAALPDQLDEPPAEPEVTFADMIELD
jgi:hypothetical protein